MSQDLPEFEARSQDEWRLELLREDVDLAAKRYAREIRKKAESARRSLGQSLRWGAARIFNYREK